MSEQLRFYAALKGVANENLTNEVLEIVRSVGLEEKADALAKTLSGKFTLCGGDVSAGGMKRRLCIGLALVGGSKVCGPLLRRIISLSS